MQNNNGPTVALIVAGGKGTRFSSTGSKQYHQIEGLPILRHTVLAFLAVPEIQHIQVVIHPDDVTLYEQAVAGLPLLTPIFGGNTRQDSVRLGLEAIEPLQPSHVLIHDAARPFLSPALILRVMEALKSAPAVIPTLAIPDTVKQLQHAIITGTLDREKLGIAQTPQGFDYRTILALHQHYKEQPHTDDAALCERAAIPVTAIKGEIKNHKVTTQEDIMTQYETRVGTGFDAHRFKESASTEPYVMLCGVKVPHSMTLEAHSDGDVALHALVDALLGAIGDGDIGQHFPPSDPQWKNADSCQFVEHACNLVKQAGGRIVNADLTLIGETPRIGPYRTEMEERVASILNIAVNRVNIKATTTEKMGFTGRKEGLAAQAVVSVEMERGVI